MVTAVPASQFCCGFPLPLGMKIILVGNLIINLAIVMLATGQVIFKVTGFGVLGSESAACWIGGFAIAGLPLIVLALHGVYHRNEVEVRIYMFYLMLAVGLISVIVIYDFLITGGCNDGMPDVFGQYGKAWACGIFRIANLLVVFTSLSILAYFTFVVYSFAEDLAEVGGGPELSDLRFQRSLHANKQPARDAYYQVQGLMEQTSDYGTYKSLYDSRAAHSTGGSNSIFGSGYHELAYPPPKIREVIM